MSALYLIDGMSLVFRAYHAMAKSNLTSATGEPTGAVFAFANILTTLLEKHKPEKIAVVFDTSEPTFRHKLYTEYKANRAEFPEELVPQLGRIKTLLHYMGIRQVELHGYEADDIIGTLAKQAAGHGVNVFCVTSDKDFYQLVDEHIKILKPSRTGPDLEMVDYPEVFEKFGVKPNQVVDVQALIGDAVDNVPGVKGVGEMYAKPLIQEYGSLEGLYENIDKVEKKAVKEKLIANKEMAFLSKQLVTMDLNVPIDETHLDCDLQSPNGNMLSEFFTEMGFSTLKVKWAERSGNLSLTMESELAEEENKVDNISDMQHDYKLVDDWSGFDSMFKDLVQFKILSFDLETSSLDRNNCEIVGVALSAKEYTGYYIATVDGGAVQGDDLFSIPQEVINYKALPIKDVLEKLKPILEDQAIGKCGQNCKFDTYILKRFGVEVSPIEFDSMLASYVLNPDSKHNMDDMSEKWLNYRPISIKSLIGEKKSTQKSMKDLDPKEISNYACEDSDVALRLRNKLIAELEKTGQTPLARNLEFPLVEVLTRMESAGIAIDSIALKEISNKIEITARELTEKIYEEAGQSFNIDSPKQLGQILFEKMQIPPVKQTKTGQSTDVEVLTQLSYSFPIAANVLEYRSLVKLKSTYIDALPKLVNKKTNRIHTTYNQTVASTGRLSSTDPNLQNIPIRTELGKEVRRAFVSGNPNSVILSADYSQIELRIMAHICNDDTLVEAFRNGLDIHAATAAVLYDKKQEEVTSDMRRVAKTVNFGIMYGLGAFGLAQRLSISRSEAKNIIDTYFEKYSGIRKYIDLTVEFTAKHGYAETLCGRRRYFPEILSSNRTVKQQAERAAINMPIQGTASDMMKIAMISIDNELRQRKMKSIMMLQVHDELVFEVPAEEVEELRLLVKELMEGSLPLGRVPVLVETGVGKNWFEAH